MPWQPPSLTVKWGPYFAPDPTEQKQIVDMVVAAMGGSGREPLITKRQAVEKLAPIFGIENIEAALLALEKENEERAQRELDAAAAAIAATDGAGRPSKAAPAEPAVPGSGGGRPPGGQKPPVGKPPG